MELITDRTQADVDRARTLNAKGWARMTAEEQAEWSAGLKGAYNHTDLNRVEQAVSELAEVLGVTVAVKTDWTAQDVPRNADMERYLGNIRRLRAKSAGLAGTPALPTSMAGLDYAGANSIEQFLLDLEVIITTWFRCGETWCGEG